MHVKVLLPENKGKKKGSHRPPFDISNWPGYFFIYITSFTSFTVRGTSGRYAATRLGA